METISIDEEIINNILSFNTSYDMLLNDYVKWSLNKRNKFIFSSGIYIIKNIVNNKIYIGSTKNFKKRIKEHLLLLNNNAHSNKKLQNAINKYTFVNFKIMFFPLNISRNELFDIEAFCISKLDCVKFGYNNTVDSRCNEFSEEQRIKIGLRMSKINKGVPKTVEHRKKCGESISKTCRGENNSQALFKKEDVLFIRNNTSLGVSALALKFGVKKAVIRQVIHLRTYNYPEYIPNNYFIPKFIGGKYKFNKEERLKIIELYNTGNYRDV